VLQGKVAKVIGLDSYPVARTNISIDVFHLLTGYRCPISTVQSVRVDSPRLAASVVSPAEEQTRPPQPQCVSAAVPPRVSGEVSRGRVFRRGRQGAPRGLPGDRAAARDCVRGDRDRPGPRAFPRAGASDLQPDQAGPGDQESDRPGDLPPGAGREEAPVGRGVLVGWLLH
jgi:hypothetical protein